MNAANPGLEPDLSGQVLDRYRLIRLLGVGGMGAVYEAEHTALEKRVAVKLLRQQFTMQQIARKRFLREAKAATRVKHPNVVDISDFGETVEGRVYFVMELLTGRDLREVLEAEPQLSWPRVQHILVQTTSALEAAHSTGIVHRDMKPSNCFLVEAPGLEDQDFIKVLDFGIAKFAGNVGEETQGLTSTDEIFGTVGYMAPEMAIGTTNDPRSDVYAIGVMMYRMLVGELPFAGNTAFQILAKHVNESPPRPRDKVPSLPEGVEAIILKALAKKADDRFASMKDFRDALRDGGLDGPADGGPRRPPPLRMSPKAPPRAEADDLLTRPRGAPAVEATQHLSASIARPRPPAIKPPGHHKVSPAPRSPSAAASRPASRQEVQAALRSSSAAPSPSRPPNRTPPPAPSRAAPGRSTFETSQPMTQPTAHAAVEGATVVARPLDYGSASFAKAQAPAAPPRSGPGPAPGVPLVEDATVVSTPIDVSTPWAAPRSTTVEPNPLQPSPAAPSFAAVSHEPQSSSQQLSPMPSIGGEPVSESFSLVDEDESTHRRTGALVATSMVAVTLVAALIWLGASSDDPPDDDTAVALETKSSKAEVPPDATKLPENEPPEPELRIDDEPSDPAPSEPEQVASPEPEPTAEPEPEPEIDPVPPEPKVLEQKVAPRKKPPKKPQPKEKPTRADAKPLTDAQVANNLRSKVIAKCKADGTTAIQVEGAISTAGKVLSPVVRPNSDRNECVRKVVKGAKFPATGSMRGMPIINVKL
ncbi:serine/threonine-protein kinase [Paraliomyxa miuraensis]|uniref:serine/threonine-protein kinase n=1 Tax=Paraliomyxa miuraensis TaxID=376150 RepID=UPI002253773E|nr:serine/threonine-protein kinase [Paraliomyxa miuraensis]MCX4241759.1 protein kinase [Paraliomyxa miuraensis]